ncbi:MAG: hypothetical protein PF508_10995 [Spirochaeta sp.]|jgi:hypothetical protein|nr:hypothetical protein [Spirochaeta sp.]
MVLGLKQLLLPGLLVFLLAATHAPAQQLSVTTRLHNEEIYFPDSVIELYITIENETARTHRFQLADDRAYNLEFVMRDESNAPVEAEEDGIIPGELNQVFYRTISLEPGDRFSFVERLTDYVTPNRPGLYTLETRFYPELISVADQDVLVSNPVTVSIRPGETPERRTQERFVAVAEQQLQRRQLPPDETVSYMIEARRQGNWDRFFLYLNVEKLFRQSDARDRRYTRGASEAAQREMLDEYRQELRNASEPADTALTVVPDSYRIIETSYRPTEGTVVAELNFDFDRYRERKRYTYQLERRNGFWEIIGYSVTNLPNEALPQ